ncbi:hypothetical protein [Crocinitomix catalasitica]|uniref:hypothetical protein n=1 Tax=Crocinitomix catalasitica TaxID=184607 RepID=UPI000488C2C7|nr:hypothetical protein [Crocinitomix catalasitica]
MDFILYNVSKETIKDFNTFLNELNGIVQLISVVDAPGLANVPLVSDDNKIFRFTASENDYTIDFYGEILAEEKVVDFGLKFKNKSIFSVNAVEKLGGAFNIAFKLNTDNESTIRQEIERTFIEMDEPINFDHQAAEIPSELNTTVETNSIPVPVSTVDNDVQAVANNAEALVEEVDFEINQFDLGDDLILKLNAAAHDLTRGAAPEFSVSQLKETTLENGANIKLVDLENSTHKLIYRNGSLGDLSEISFFVETKSADLIAEVYLSSEGRARFISNYQNKAGNIKTIRAIIGL